MENTGIIKISETHETEISANSAKLNITITGENFIYGNAALEKCAEVKNLVEALKTLGVTDDCLTVESVSSYTETGIFTKQSKGIYKIVVRVENLALLSSVLGAIAEQKNCHLEMLEWVFEEDEARFEATKQALVKAKRKADLMAEVLDYKITGIKNCWDSHQAQQEVPNVFFGQPKAAPMMARSRFGSDSVAQMDIGTVFRGEKQILVTVTVEFLVSKTES